MEKKIKDELSSKINKKFKEELQFIIGMKLDEINHYIAGCNTPFDYLQVSEAQEKMCEIAEILGIKGE